MTTRSDTALPYYPLWAIVIIAVDVFVIWALATARPNPGSKDSVVPETADYRTTGSPR
jgi:hypothetical protein